MQIELSDDEIHTILTSLQYSLRAISDAPGTPAEVRKENVGRVEAVREKLRTALRQKQS